jgi:hypothetical protein
MMTRAGENIGSRCPARLGCGVPGGEGGDLILRDVRPVLGPQEVLGEDLQGVRELLGAGDRVEAVDRVAALADPRSERAPKESMLVMCPPGLFSKPVAPEKADLSRHQD